MGVRAIQCLFFLLGVLFCSGILVKESDDISSTSPASLQTTKLYDPTEKYVIQRPERKSHRLLSAGTRLEFASTLPQMDVVNPVATVPIVNPSNSNPATTTTPTYPSYNPISTPSSPTTPTMTPGTNPYSTPMTPSTNPYSTPMTPSTNPYSTPMTAPPSSSGQSWCIASQTASETALQVALDYACGFGGADCSAIQQGGSCFNPDTLRDHASYAFNNYYEKNPAPTSCDFGGTAVITNIDPSSSSACQFPSTSTSSSVLNTTNPTGSTVFGSSAPPATTSSASKPQSMMIFIGLILFLKPLFSLNVYK